MPSALRRSLCWLSCCLQKHRHGCLCHGKFRSARAAHCQPGAKWLADSRLPRGRRRALNADPSTALNLFDTVMDAVVELLVAARDDALAGTNLEAKPGRLSAGRRGWRRWWLKICRPGLCCDLLRCEALGTLRMRRSALADRIIRRSGTIWVPLNPRGGGVLADGSDEWSEVVKSGVLRSRGDSLRSARASQEQVEPCFDTLTTQSTPWKFCGGGEVRRTGGQTCARSLRQPSRNLQDMQTLDGVIKANRRRQQGLRARRSARQRRSDARAARAACDHRRRPHAGRAGAGARARAPAAAEHVGRRARAVEVARRRTAASPASSSARRRSAGRSRISCRFRVSPRDRADRGGRGGGGRDETAASAARGWSSATIA